jgi:hypothetical protein
MFKIGSNDRFGYLKHKLWPKEGSEVKLPIWLLITKSRLDSLAFRWRATYCWKTFDKGYNFSSKIILIEGLNIKLWASKVAGVPILGILGLQLGSPDTKWHLGAGPMAKHKVTYKGEGGGFPQVRAVVSLVNVCLSMARSCTKNAFAMH